MANRRYEEEPGSWGNAGPQGGRWQTRGTRDDPTRGRPGGSYGLGGPERGYNQGGFDASNYEEGYTPRSYERMLGLTEGFRGYADEDTGYENREGWGSEQGYRGGGPSWPTERVGREPRPLGKVPRGYTRSDERIREDICERLIDSPYDASDVEVQVKDGEVTLEGTAHDRGDKRAIEDIAAAARGVFDVHNRIRVVERDRRLGDPDLKKKLHS